MLAAWRQTRVLIQDDVARLVHSTRSTVVTQGPARQPRRSRAGTVDGPDTAVGTPQRQFRPLLHTPPDKPVGISPNWHGVSAGHRDAGIDEFGEGGMADRGGDVERAVALPLRAGQGERGDVAYVDRLVRPLRWAGRQELAIMDGAGQPPGQAANVFVRAENHAGTQDDGPLLADG